MSVSYARLVRSELSSSDVAELDGDWREDGMARKRPFVRVTRRIGAFFGDPRREVDVLSAHLFGYGRSV